MKQSTENSVIDHLKRKLEKTEEPALVAFVIDKENATVNVTLIEQHDTKPVWSTVMPVLKDVATIEVERPNGKSNIILTIYTCLKDDLLEDIKAVVKED